MTNRFNLRGKFRAADAKRLGPAFAENQKKEKQFP